MTAVLTCSDEVVLDGGVLRQVLRALAASVVVVTARLPDGRPVGFTATSLVPVSLDPPLLGVFVGAAASSLPALSVGGDLVVHLLDHDQAHLAERFAGPAARRFDGLPLAPSEGAPRLADARTWLACRIAERLPTGDHDLVLARPLAAVDGADDGGPLLHHRSRWASLRQGS